MPNIITSVLLRAASLILAVRRRERNTCPALTAPQGAA